MNDAQEPRVIITCGEPAGIGPEISLRLASHNMPLGLACCADAYLLVSLSEELNLGIEINVLEPGDEIPPQITGQLNVFHCELKTEVKPGILDPQNSRYVLDCLDTAINACLEQRADAIVTGPLQKSIINDAGIPFSGHTEYLANKTAPDVQPVMMLTSAQLRIALVTTHLGLAEVPAKITTTAVFHAIMTMDKALREDFRIPNPRLAVCGLNPHAGETGHFGREEIIAISPAIESARIAGVTLEGPIPADTAFTPNNRERFDGYISMFHDQGLPVIKALDFSEIVNVTLGLPIIRTSVDHGTALDIAGQGIANPKSLLTAVEMAKNIVTGRRA